MVALILFLAAVAGAFIGFVSPLFSADAVRFRGPALKTSALLMLGALGGLGLDWAFHHLR
ncbi:MAG TPA: hypothetical protein VI541_02485 [Actinomycetota bacterium]|nr:hypothetical protein [Actinomycetota bacterium]